ncbi:MAG: signal peptidase I [Oscillospiraceae bacterium]|nr:signal peptidase I [Oscillospiraceae bacterium]
MKKFYEILESAAVSVITLTLVILFVCRFIVVDGGSMDNTLHHGERLIISNFMYTPEKGDIVVTDSNNLFNRPIIKRVIATEGDIIAIDYNTGDVYVNGLLLQENYIKEKIIATGGGVYQIQMGDNQLFLMGDNRNASSDSRVREIGPVNEKDILGRVILRVSPISKFGKVN